jgi:hypothetical protein
MGSKNRLLAAVTASGLMLCLNVSTDASVAIKDTDPTIDKGKSLSFRVNELREKLGTLAPAFEDDKAGSRIDNIVQFFNFFNCFRPGWRNC